MADFLRLTFASGESRDVNCAHAGLSWPPPHELRIFGSEFVRISLSEGPEHRRAEYRQQVDVVGCN